MDVKIEILRQIVRCAFCLLDVLLCEGFSAHPALVSKHRSGLTKTVWSCNAVGSCLSSSTDGFFGLVAKATWAHMAFPAAKERAESYRAEISLQKAQQEEKKITVASGGTGSDKIYDIVVDLDAQPAAIGKA